MSRTKKYSILDRIKAFFFPFFSSPPVVLESVIKSIDSAQEEKSTEKNDIAYKAYQEKLAEWSLFKVSLRNDPLLEGILSRELHEYREVLIEELAEMYVTNDIKIRILAVTRMKEFDIYQEVTIRAAGKRKYRKE